LLPGPRLRVSVWARTTAARTSRLAGRLAGPAPHAYQSDDARGGPKGPERCGEVGKGQHLRVGSTIKARESRRRPHTCTYY